MYIYFVYIFLKSHVKCVSKIVSIKNITFIRQNLRGFLCKYQIHMISI